MEEQIQDRVSLRQIWPVSIALIRHNLIDISLWFEV